MKPRIALLGLLLIALAGCTNQSESSAATPSATPVDYALVIKGACGESLNINSAINTADWALAVDESITADEWLKVLIEGKAQAAREAMLAAGTPYAAAVEQYAEMIEQFDETPPESQPERNWMSPILFVEACKDANMTYGVGGGGAVGG